MQPVTVTYSLSEEAFIHAARALWSYRGIGDRGNWLTTIIALAVGPVLLTNGLAAGWLFIAAGAIFVVLTLLRNLLWRRAYRKMAKYTAPITAVFGPDTVHVSSAEGDNTLPWSSFKNYAETPDYYFLFMGWRGLSIIPKTAFESDEDNEQTRLYMTTHLKRRKMRWT